MNLKVLMNSYMGKVFISILLGLGLATMFRTVCKEKECIRFHGPIISEMDGKIYKHGDRCYQYKVESSGQCDTNKRVLDIRDKPTEGDHGLGF
jgi:hypothetical protein